MRPVPGFSTTHAYGPTLFLLSNSCGDEKWGTMDDRWWPCAGIILRANACLHMSFPYLGSRSKSQGAIATDRNSWVCFLSLAAQNSLLSTWRFQLRLGSSVSECFCWPIKFSEMNMFWSFRFLLTWVESPLIVHGMWHIRLDSWKKKLNQVRGCISKLNPAFIWSPIHRNINMSEFWGQFFQNEPYRPYQQHEIHKYWLLLPFWLLASLLSHFPKSCCWHLGVQPQVLVTAVMLGMLGFTGHQPFLGTCNGSDLDPTWSYLILPE